MCVFDWKKMAKEEEKNLQESFKGMKAQGSNLSRSYVTGRAGKGIEL